MRKIVEMILGQDEHQRYPELYKGKDLPGSRNLDYYSLIAGGVTRREEPRSFDWKSL
jgi:hypothetical protein